MEEEAPTNTNIALFEHRTVRRVWYNDSWYFSVIDVVAALTDSENPNRYWSDLKRKLMSEGYTQVYDLIVRLKLEAPDGKMRLTDTANTTTLLRIIQSIPSPKAEPFKQWLAEVATQHLQEIENPELTIERMRTMYREQGYPEEWIEKRIQSIIVRDELTQEWKLRGAQEGKEYAILTSEIAKTTFGLSVQDHKSIKGLRRENLRDHMTPMELVLTMLGEVTTTELHRDRDSQGFSKLHRDARDGGAVAGRARQDIESQLGTPVVSSTNFLPKESGSKRLLRLQGTQPDESSGEPTE